MADPHLPGSGADVVVDTEVRESDYPIAVQIHYRVARVHLLVKFLLKKSKIRGIAHSALVKVAVARVAEAIQIVIALIRAVFTRVGHVIGAGPVGATETVVFRVGDAVPVAVQQANEATIGAS
jgi:hypothetical protein